MIKILKEEECMSFLRSLENKINFRESVWKLESV